MKKWSAFWRLQNLQNEFWRIRRFWRLKIVRTLVFIRWGDWIFRPSNSPGTPETLFLRIPWFYNFFENFAPSGYRNSIFAAMKGLKTNHRTLFWHLVLPSREISSGASSIFKTFNIFTIGLWRSWLHQNCDCWSMRRVVPAWFLMTTEHRVASGKSHIRGHLFFKGQQGLCF